MKKNNAKRKFILLPFFIPLHYGFCYVTVFNFPQRYRVTLIKTFNVMLHVPVFRYQQCIFEKIFIELRHQSPSMPVVHDIQTI
jgi:hypothetical protein